DQDLDGHSEDMILQIQERLFTIGSTLATEPQKAILKSGKERLNINKISEGDIELLEQEMDRMNEELPPLTHFILPGGHQTVSFCHVARGVCRRAERLATALYDTEPFDPRVLI